MTVDLAQLLHQTLFGALAACGFGILFNFGWREMPWCAASGALALFVRSLGQEIGWSMEAATFAAAAMVGCGGRLLRAYIGIAGNALAVAGCIPLVPGGFAAQTIFGLFALTSPQPDHPEIMVVTAMEYTLRVLFTFGAIGAGLSISTHILRSRDF